MPQERLNINTEVDNPQEEENFELTKEEKKQRRKYRLFVSLCIVAAIIIILIGVEITFLIVNSL